MAMRSDASRRWDRPTGAVQAGYGSWGVGVHASQTPTSVLTQAQDDYQQRQELLNPTPPTAAELAANAERTRNAAAWKFRAKEPDRIDELMKYVFAGLSRRTRRTSFLTGDTAFSNQGRQPTILGF